MQNLNLHVMQVGANNDRNTASSDEYTVKERLDEGLVFDVSHESGPSLLLRAGFGGYKLDVWWGTDNNRQSNNWIRLGERPDSSYPYENDHDRDAELSIHEIDGSEVVTIVDPEPRTEAVGYDPATLTIEFVEDEGFHVTAEWVHESTGTTRKSFAIAPVFDPRIEDQRERHYDLLDQNCNGQEPREKPLSEQAEATVAGVDHA